MNFLNGWKKDATAANKLTGVLFLVYLGALLWIIVLKLNTSFSYNGKTGNVNLIPFHAPVLLNGKVGYSEMILNVLIFVPLGLYIGILFKKLSTCKKILSFFSVSLLCEVLQFVLKIGAFDITDIITNTFGGIIGWVLFQATEKGFKNTVKTQKFINIIATLGTVLLLSLLMYLKISKQLMFRR